MCFHHYMYVHYLDVFTSGIWEELGACETPELKRLTTAIQTTIIQSRASSTAKKYLAAFHCWED